MKENTEVYVQLFSHTYTFLLPLHSLNMAAIEKDLQLRKDHDGNYYLQDQFIRMYSFSALLQEPAEEELICCVLKQHDQQMVLRVHNVGDVITLTSPIHALSKYVRTKENSFLGGCVCYAEHEVGYVIDVEKLFHDVQESVSL